jgi:hypothetical protein
MEQKAVWTGNSNDMLKQSSYMLSVCSSHHALSSFRYEDWSRSGYFALDASTMWLNAWHWALGSQFLTLAHFVVILWPYCRPQQWRHSLLPNILWPYCRPQQWRHSLLPHILWPYCRPQQWRHSLLPHILWPLKLHMHLRNLWSLS